MAVVRVLLQDGISTSNALSVQQLIMRLLRGCNKHRVLLFCFGVCELLVQTIGTY